MNADKINESGEQNQEIDTKLLVATKITEKYSEQNYEFMIDFVKTYQEDAGKAKQSYYQQKVKLDTSSKEG